VQGGFKKAHELHDDINEMRQWLSDKIVPRSISIREVDSSTYLVIVVLVLIRGGLHERLEAPTNRLGVLSSYTHLDRG
jgi:hypothetical protein